MRRQGILIAVIAGIFAVLLISYLFVIRPIEKEDSKVKETEPPETEEGEALGTSDRYFLFTSLERSDIESIEVDNSHGGYTFVSDENGDFKLKGYEGLSIDATLFSSLVSVSTYTLSKTKVGSFLSDEKIAEYGLDKPQASWIVTDKNGNRFRVFVGDRLLTGGGYYCMFDGRKSVYVLGNDVEDTILAPKESFVTAVLCTGISQNDYFDVDNFTVYRNGETLTQICLVDKEDQVNKEALAENIMVYPTKYYPNSSLYYDIIYQFMSLSADTCEKVGATKEDLEKYGLLSPAHAIIFDYHDINFRIYFSEEQNGKYYAFSNISQDVIGSVSAEDFKYLEYDLIKWIDPYVFQQYITDIDEMNVSYGDTKASFKITHIPVESTDGKKNENISVNANGKALSDSASENFRQYYKSFLALSIIDYCKDDEYCTLSEAEIFELSKTPEKADLTFTYKKLSGETGTLRFYRYSTRHSLVTVDGVGEFYVLTDLVDKIKNDTEKVLSGEDVTAYSKN